MVRGNGFLALPPFGPPEGALKGPLALLPHKGGEEGGGIPGRGGRATRRLWSDIV